MAQEQATDTKAAPVIENLYQVFLWPLQIVLPDTGQAEKLDPSEWFRRVDACLRCKGSPWEELKDHYDRGTSEQTVTRYAEFVYFHPFVQRFLYGCPEPDPERPLRLYRRSDISQAKVVLKDDSKPVDLDIKRIHLYLFNMEVAVLAVEVFARESLALKTTENLLDQFRRAYPPYWEENEWDLRLMSVAATKDLLDVGRNLIIVALVGADLHIRIFDASGKKVVDKAENELISGEILTALKKRLNPFPDESSLSKEDKQEIIRNATPIAGHTQENKAGHCLAKVTWLNCNGDIMSESDYCDQGRFQTFVKEYLSPPVARHWADLLAPIEVYKPGEQKDHWSLKRRLFFRLIGDERIPYMAYLALKKPEGLTRGDWVRIALAEEAGPSAILPYSQAFLADFEKRYCYDPYWGESFCDQGWMNTRYLCCGYAFTVVGSSSDWRFYTNPTTGLLAHFRHHYFQMGLIIHFQHAALLMISDRLAEAVTRFQSGETQRQRFHKDIQAIQESLLRFTHRYWFPEVSNHIQGRELFQFWRQHLGTQALYEQVTREVQETNQYLDAWQQAERTQTTVRLTEVAAVGLGLSIVAGLLGMNLIQSNKNLTFYFGEYGYSSWKLVVGSVVVTAVSMGLLIGLWHLMRLCKRLLARACGWIIRRGQSR